MPGDGTRGTGGTAPSGVAVPGRDRGPVVAHPSASRRLGRDDGSARPSTRPRPAFGADPRQVPAGKVLAVGLICFFVWLMLDARQLYNSALGSPIGVRRSVAISILRPIARVRAKRSRWTVR